LKSTILNGTKKASSQYIDQEMLIPAKTGYVLLTLIAALILNFIPLNALLLSLRPDFIALIILYWRINQPQRLGMTLAFCAGLMMDVHHAGILGHNAMVYCTVVYLASVFRRRIRIFSLIKQAPQIGLILIAMQTLQILITMFNDANFPGWHFYLPSLTGALLWPVFAYMLSLPLRSRNDNTR
jgi:rod shape-determining protein MreD